MTPGYVYNGTLRGELDPWAPKPRPERTPPTPAPLQPCGTHAAHKRHMEHGEEPCEPCKEAKRDYDREWYAANKPEPAPKLEYTPDMIAYAKAKKAAYNRERSKRPEVRAKRREVERARYWRKKEEG